MPVHHSQKLVLQSLGRAPGDRLRATGDMNVLRLEVDSPERRVVLLLDGTRTLEEVLAMTDLPSGRLQRLVQRMQILGLVEIVAPASTPVPPAPAPTATPRTAVKPPLSPEQEETIRREYGRVRSAAPHEVLSLPERAPAKEVQRAYYALVQRFHPDVFFGRDLGVLEGQLFEITQRHFDSYKKMRDGPPPEEAPPPAPPSAPPPEAPAAADPDASLGTEAQQQFEKGLEFFRKNDYVRARPYFELACAFEPGNATYREHLTRVKKGLGISD